VAEIYDARTDFALSGIREKAGRHNVAKPAKKRPKFLFFKIVAQVTDVKGILWKVVWNGVEGRHSKWEPFKCRPSPRGKRRSYREQRN
jgi:hypothetical protein